MQVEDDVPSSSPRRCNRAPGTGVGRADVEYEGVLTGEPVYTAVGVLLGVVDGDAPGDREVDGETVGETEHRRG